jgi:hypothetical protein
MLAGTGRFLLAARATSPARALCQAGVNAPLTGIILMPLSPVDSMLYMRPAPDSAATINHAFSTALTRMAQIDQRSGEKRSDRNALVRLSPHGMVIS